MEGLHRLGAPQGPGGPFIERQQMSASCARSAVGARDAVTGKNCGPARETSYAGSLMRAMSSSDRPEVPVPLHTVSYDGEGRRLAAVRRGGRPRKVALAPTASEADYIEQVNKARDRHVGDDVLVNAVRGRADADQVLGAIVAGLALETASLAWDIRQGRKGGKDVAQVCSRRIDGLAKIALVELGRVKLGLGNELTPDDPRKKVIVDCFLSSLDDVLASSLPADKYAMVMALIEDRLRAWQCETPR